MNNISRASLKSFAVISLCALIVTSTTACRGQRLADRDRPNEMLVARQAPLVLPPDYGLLPPEPGAARPNVDSPAQQTLQALFGGPASLSVSERDLIDRAAIDEGSTSGIRSTVGDAETRVIDKGEFTRELLEAPESESTSEAPMEVPAEVLEDPSEDPSPEAN